jgi:hypothetical protein
MTSLREIASRILEMNGHEPMHIRDIAKQAIEREDIKKSTKLVHDTASAIWNDIISKKAESSFVMKVVIISA